jgi:F420-dependent oxidoreductase-like protein
MRVPITLSLHLPNFNYPGVEADGLLEQLAAIATTAEESGYSGVTVMDHFHQIPGVGRRTNFMLEGNATLGALAARTSTANLGLMVGGVTYRNPALLAKTATTLDVLSGGRAFLGIGAAWFEEEHLAYGFGFPPLKERFERLEDALNIARRMFTDEESSYAGTHHSTENALNNPRPIRGDIPILIGGSGERKTLRMVAEYADGSNIFGDLDRVRHLLGVLADHCERLGRDPDEITKTRMATVVLAQTREEAERKLAEHVERSGSNAERARMMAFMGGPEDIAEQAQGLLDGGLDGFTVSMPDVHDLDAVAQVGQAIGPLVGAPA